MRHAVAALALAALVSCSPAVPDDTGGIGFGSYGDYQRQKASRDAQLRAAALPPPTAVSSEALRPVSPASQIATAQSSETLAPVAGTAPAPSEDAEYLAKEARAALEATALNSGVAPLQASPSNPPPSVENAAGISEENNFDAVGAQRSIEEDAARIAQNRAQYQIVAPAPVGERPADVGPNIVSYALANKHPVGAQVYSRMGINKEARFERNCAAYAAPDLAQIDFLQHGGPERDKMGLDPDGDGYACGWDPTPFRAAVGE